jgi:hypothetical protein
MPEIIKIKCNGPNKHINEVDLDDALREQPIARLTDASYSSMPDRIVLRCRECVDGRVIVTRAIIERARGE